MERVFAWLFVLSAAVLCQLGNFWFTYGIWPRSWLAFVLFALIGVALSKALSRLIEGDKG